MMMPMLLAALWGIVVAGTGAMLTSLTPWYYALRKPSWQPPDWLFGPAWSVILTLASVSAYLGWQHAATTGQRTLVVLLFLANGALNILWRPAVFPLAPARPGIGRGAAPVAVDPGADYRAGADIAVGEPADGAVFDLGVVRHGAQHRDRAPELSVRHRARVEHAASS